MEKDSDGDVVVGVVDMVVTLTHEKAKVYSDGCVMKKLMVQRVYGGGRGRRVVLAMER